MKTIILYSFFLQGLAQAMDPSSYFGGSGNEGYTAWLRGAWYSRTAFIESAQDERSGVALHWTIEGETIKLAVAAKAEGWVGFGLGESGSMLGADIVMYSAQSNELVDSYVLDQATMPYRDECQSWTLIDSTVQDGFIIFEASRLLNTDDSQDRVLLDDSDELVAATRVLAAWGDSASPSYHGDSIARAAVRFFGNTSVTEELEVFASTMASEAEGNFTVRANNYIIPTDRTTYAHFCVSAEELLAMNVDLDQDLHTIGFEPFIDPRTKKHVHHFSLTAMSSPWNSSLSCDDFPGVEIVYVWAPGDIPFSLPSYIGSPLGSTGFQSFRLEIHYDNADGTPNMTDDSGIRLYYTSKKREFDLGVFATGDPDVSLEGEVVSSSGGLAQHIFDCESSCTSQMSAPVTVIREYLHMHTVGASMVNSQIRNGAVIHEGIVEYWDFQQQGNLVVQQPPFEIQPGDAFRTVCNYNTKHNETWGLGSNNEMCLAILYYYPRRLIASDYGDIPLMCGLGLDEALPGCGATHEVTPDFVDSRQLGRVFGTMSDACGSSAPSDSSGPSSSAVKAILGYVGACVTASSLLSFW
jgi:DOMON domain/Copper type II ascorbate-dependent monooxygenase, N-terminal domain/Copper type II ascorbate-dependent monooxygenase, C-terminal domain